MHREEKDAREGVEITHPTYGRGVVTEYRPNFGAEPDNLVVHLCDQEQEKTLPVHAVELAAKAATTSITQGSFGFQAVVDDGHTTVAVQPDGDGGYTVETRIDGELQDVATLSLEQV